MNKEFKVGDKKWWTTYNVFCEIVDIKYDENSKPFEWIVDTKGLKGIRFDLFRIEELHQTADDMFKELGFERQENNIFGKRNGSWYETIEFYSNYYMHIEWNEDEEETRAVATTIEEHQAIHQKLIELGYIE